MKQILLLIILCAFSTKFYGQKVTTTKVKFENIDTLVYRDVDVRASFTKAEAGWRKFLVQNLNSMVLVDAGAPSGTYTVLVTFIVRADGKVANLRCDNAPGYGICEEGIRSFIKTSLKNCDFSRIENYADSFRINVKTSEPTLYVLSIYIKSEGLVYLKTLPGFRIFTDREKQFALPLL